MNEVLEFLRRMYDAYAAQDIAAMDAQMADGIVVHVAGQHPLSGDYVGKAAVWGYLAKVREVSGGEGGFEVHALTASEDGHGVAVLTGTIREHRRQVVHVVHVSDGQLTELWDAYTDGAAEDAFWKSALA